MIEEIQDTLCEKCRRPVLITDIKYVAKPNGTRMALCSKCRAKPTVMEQITPHKKDSSKRESYECIRCNYKFKFDPYGVTALKCPYCGHTDKVQKVEDHMGI